MNDFESSLQQYVDEQDLAALNKMWEVPSIGMFLNLYQVPLNLPKITQLELELGFLVRKSPVIPSVIHAMFKGNHDFNSKIKARVRCWLKALDRFRNDEIKTAMYLNIDPAFFKVLNSTDPYSKHTDYFDFPIDVRVWLIKTICDQKSVSVTGFSPDPASKPVKLIAGGNSSHFLFFKCFLPDIRVYQVHCDKFFLVAATKSEIIKLSQKLKGSKRSKGLRQQLLQWSEESDDEAARKNRTDVIKSLLDSIQVKEKSEVILNKEIQNENEICKNERLSDEEINCLEIVSTSSNDSNDSCYEPYVRKEKRKKTKETSLAVHLTRTSNQKCPVPSCSKKSKSSPVGKKQQPVKAHANPLNFNYPNDQQISEIISRAVNNFKAFSPTITLLKCSNMNVQNVFSFNRVTNTVTTPSTASSQCSNSAFDSFVTGNGVQNSNQITSKTSSVNQSYVLLSANTTPSTSFFMTNSRTIVLPNNTRHSLSRLFVNAAPRLSENSFCNKTNISIPLDQMYTKRFKPLKPKSPQSNYNPFQWCTKSESAN